MSKSSKRSINLDTNLIEVKSKFEAEFRRFSLSKGNPITYERFERLVEGIHGLKQIPFIVCYTDATHGDLLPINNDENLAYALTAARPLLRLNIQRKGDSIEYAGFGNTLTKKKNPLTKLISAEVKHRSTAVAISLPEDFRRVSAIIDVDVIPETHRRVRLCKNGTDKPLGFYIRDGTSVRVTSHGLEKVPGIFISRLVPGGLAESTGLLAVNDEVLEVNGIEVAGKTLDQVTDMMVANSSNLIITVKPVNQRNNISPKRGAADRISQKSTGSLQSGQSMSSDEIRDVYEDDEDDICDHLGISTGAATTQESIDTSVAIKDGSNLSHETSDEGIQDTSSNSLKESKDNLIVTL